MLESSFPESPREDELKAEVCCQSVYVFFSGNRRIFFQGVFRYYRCNMLREEVLRAEGVPVGLKNIGNTCHVNSLLQTIFSVIPFREQVRSSSTTLLSNYCRHCVDFSNRDRRRTAYMFVLVSFYC